MSNNKKDFLKTFGLTLFSAFSIGVGVLDVLFGIDAIVHDVCGTPRGHNVNFVILPDDKEEEKEKPDGTDSGTENPE